MEYNARMITLRDYVRVLFKNKIVIMLTFVMIMSAVYIGLQFQTWAYEASVKMVVSGAKESQAVYYKGLIFPETLTKNHAQLVKSNIVLERVVKALELYKRPINYERQFYSPLKAALTDYQNKEFLVQFEKATPEQKQEFLFRNAVSSLSGHISVGQIKDSDLFEIKVRDNSQQSALTIANSVSRSYIIFDLEQQIAEMQLKFGEKYQTIVQLKNYVETLKKTLDGRLLPDIEAFGPASIKVIEQARKSGYVESGINVTFGLILAFFTSAIVSVIFAFTIEYSSQTFDIPRDIEIFLGIPYLGSIQRLRKKSKNKLLTSGTGSIQLIQSYQTITDQVLLLIKDRKLTSLLIIDAEGSKETANIIANLGSCLAEKIGRRVLIVDANLRNPSQSKIFNISNNPGLVNILEGEVNFEDSIQSVGHNLYILPTKESAINPMTLLNSSAMSDVLAKAKEQFEIVLVDCVDLRNFSDAVVISSLTDGTVFIINEGKVRREVVKNAIAPLNRNKVNIIGAILNNRSYVIPKIIYKLL